MTERSIDVSSMTCGDCSFGKGIMQKIIIQGHDDVRTYYRVIFSNNPGNVLKEICPHPREGICPKKDKSD